MNDALPSSNAAEQPPHNPPTETACEAATTRQRGYEGFFVSVRDADDKVVYVSCGTALTITYDGTSVLALSGDKDARMWSPAHPARAAWRDTPSADVPAGSERASNAREIATFVEQHKSDAQVLIRGHDFLSLDDFMSLQMTGEDADIAQARNLAWVLREVSNELTGGAFVLYGELDK